MQESKNSGIIPLSYLIMAVVFATLTAVFTTTFYLGRHGGGFIIGPWTNLMLMVASIGMLVTVAVATAEWCKGKKASTRGASI